MRFPHLDQLDLPCVFTQFVPGRLHPDGKRYLPLIVLRPSAAADSVTPPGLLLGVVDRHHRVDAAALGQAGSARLVFALSALRLQAGAPRLGLQPEEGWAAEQVATTPTLFGRVLAVPAWEEERGHLPYEALYTELLLDIGIGRVGLRTSITAADLAGTIGAARVAPGDYVELRRSRIDILAFG
jgi:hypothetical protein